ncbi:Hypothetical predicted protein [Paramuricea clavata]|uniref:Uncharacterized protein n=1 Tax=Paramuricea clavata TaxID=317549 RepID=A0A7D9K4N7_PARCT|nr:Hypothetical predicted protein [Paramuricea clavata]
MLEIVTKALAKVGIKTKTTPVGPSINFQIPSHEKSFKYIDIDLVLYIKQNDWPKSADPKIDPTLKAVGVGLVAKVLEPPQDSRLWQISFSAAEIKLFQGIDADGGSRKKLLKIAKYLKIASKWPENIASYHLKTEIMKMNRDHPNKDDWTDSKLVPRFNELILNFLKSLEAGKLTSFFIPSFNLFQGKDLGTAIKRVKNLISAIETKPDSCLPPAKAPCAPSDAPSKKIPFVVTNKIPTTENKKKLPSIGKNKPLIKKLRLHR